ncbi:YbaB/EbfC family nucleoid-associated protein [Pelagibius marinus]|uniref:YbaB/EbfC family nucleoid-associated protein n=1 Tax=Pelagibius marinus TaxID=2762760 RepID=UPI001872E342|nr:YbaB/EbfC family nucleoid-associated protein [Pelagibius marinus]
MKNLGQMMKQAQAMQAKMAEMQEKLGQLEVSGQAGAGMVTATLNGKSELRALKIDPSLVDPNEVEVLEDLIVAAVNDAKAKVEAKVAEEMRQVTGGLDLPPGMTLPF